MIIRYLIECDCNTIMKDKETEFCEQLGYELHTFVCPHCHKQVKVSTDPYTVALREDLDDLEGIDCYGDEQDRNILPN